MGICHNKVTSHRAILISNIDADTNIENNFNFNTILVAPQPDIIASNHILEENEASTNEIVHKELGNKYYIISY